MTTRYLIWLPAIVLTAVLVACESDQDSGRAAKVELPFKAAIDSAEKAGEAAKDRIDRHVENDPDRSSQEIDSE